jgi:serine/threonine-protein kinase HipA
VGDTRLSNLFIWIDNQRVATLSHDAGNFELSYEASWHVSGGYPISPHLPLHETSRDAAVRNFFSNLLPEGELLTGLSQQHQIKKDNVFGLLERVGHDCAGAMVITEADQHEVNDSQGYEQSGYQHIDDEELNQQINESRQASVPLMFWNRKPRMSLAGVQNKIGVYVDTNENILLPKQSQPTSHILKIGDPRLPEMVANEYFCMQLAQAIGLSVPDTRFRLLPEPVLLVHRYDREWSGGLSAIKRLHQIDACQALDLPPNLKYEKESGYSLAGATLVDVLGLAKLCDTPSVAQITILNWILYNYLIGNTDAHAKNLSLLINHAAAAARLMGRNASIGVAPLYDLVCGTVYGLNDFAQRIGDEDNLALIGTNDWREFVKQTDLSPKLVKHLGEILIKKMSIKLDGVARTVSAETSAGKVGEVADYIRQQIVRLEESLAEL